ncbi:MAG: ATP-grasp domain-containing protein [Elusimicrobia bacterium]|nr:ATP-grasp domain-containing protein [Elusimicrobiota bacterium]
MRRALFIETNFSGVDAVLRCRAARIEPLLVTAGLAGLADKLPAGSLGRLRAAATIVQVRDPLDEEALAPVAARLRPDAILSFSQAHTLVAARLARRLGLRGADPAAVAALNDKFAMRGALERLGLESVRRLLVRRPEELDGVPQSVGFPFVVKPTRGFASVGVAVCRSRRELARLRHTLARELLPWIAEEYFEGPLVSVETLTLGRGRHQVWGLSDRALTHGVVEVGSSFPVRPPGWRAAVRHTLACLDGIGFDLGAAHTELILTASGPRIVEINARAGGTGHTQMIDAASGRSVCLDVVRAHLGLPVEPWTPPARTASRYSFWSARKGVIRALPRAATARRLEGFSDMWLFKREGSSHEGLRTNFDLLGQILCVGPDLKRAAALARVAARTLQGEVRIQ